MNTLLVALGLVACCSAVPVAKPWTVYLFTQDPTPAVVRIPAPGLSFTFPQINTQALLNTPVVIPLNYNKPVVPAPAPIPVFKAAVPVSVPVVKSAAPVPVFKAAVPVSVPVVKSVAPVPVFKAAVPVPVPVVKSAAPVPVVKSAAPVPVFKGAVPVPVIKSVAPVPVVKAAVTVPVVKAAAPAVFAAPVVVAVPPEPLNAPEPPMPSINEPFVGGQFHAQDEAKQYSFGHWGGSNTRVEVKDSLGRVSGSFAYINPDGDVQVRKYAAAPGMGFKVAASDLPEDTPAVTMVKSAHAKAHADTRNLIATAAVSTA